MEEGLLALTGILSPFASAARWPSHYKKWQNCHIVGRRKVVKKHRGGKSWLEKWANSSYKLLLNSLKVLEDFWKVKESRWFFTTGLGMSYFHVLWKVSYPLHFCKTVKTGGSKKLKYSPVRLKHFFSVWGFFCSIPPQFHSQISSLEGKWLPRNLWNSTVKLQSTGKY